MSSDCTTPRTNHRTGRRVRSSSRSSRPRRSTAAMLEDENPQQFDQGLTSVVTNEEDYEESSTSGVKLYGKPVSYFQILFGALVDEFCDSKQVTSALNTRKNEFIIDAPTHMIFDALCEMETELASVELDTTLSEEQVKLKVLFPWATQKGQMPKDKSLQHDSDKQDEKERTDLDFFLLEIFKIAFAASEKAGTDTATQEAFVYLFEAITPYEKSAQYFKNFFAKESIVNLLTKELLARANDLSKLSEFKYKTEAKKLLTEAIVGGGHLSEFVQEFDNEKAFNQAIVKNIPAEPKIIDKANADRKRVTTKPPKSKNGLEQCWIETGPDGRVPGDAPLPGQSMNQAATPTAKASSTHPQLDPSEIRAFLKGCMTVADRRAVAERLEREHPGHGYWKAFIAESKQAFPEHGFDPPAAAPSDMEASGGKASAPNAPAPGSETTGTDTTTGLADHKPNFTLEGFMQNDIVRPFLETTSYKDKMFPNLPGKVKEFNQNKTEPKTKRELAAAGRLWALNSGHFWIVKKIGEGCVFKIVSKHGEAAALKLSLVKKSRVPQDVVRSMICNCQVDHENVAQPLGWFVHELEDTKNSHILFAQLFELFADYTLEDKIAEISTTESSLKIRTVVDIIAKVASAVAALEEGGVVHRDIKPENILFGIVSGELKIGDFGLSRNAGDEKMTLKCGTPLYAAPETKTSESQSKTLDVFRVGILTYELITGRSPWKDAAGKKQQYLEIADDAFNHSSIIELRNIKVGIDFVKLVKQMLSDYTDRPTMSTVLSKMNKIQAAISEESDESV